MKEEQFMRVNGKNVSRYISTHNYQKVGCKRWERDSDPNLIPDEHKAKSSKPFYQKVKKEAQYQGLCEECGNLIASNGSCLICGHQNDPSKVKMIEVDNSTEVNEESKKLNRQNERLKLKKQAEIKKALHNQEYAKTYSLIEEYEKQYPGLDFEKIKDALGKMLKKGESPS